MYWGNAMSLANNPIVIELHSQYECGVLVADPLPVIWAAESVMRQQGIEIARLAVHHVNARRRKAGIIPARFNYGHPLF